MRQVDAVAFEKVKSALLDCIATNTNLAGLRIIPPKLEDDAVESAATIALMSLCRDWVRPNNVQFGIGDGRFV